MTTQHPHETQLIQELYAYLEGWDLSQRELARLELGVDRASFRVYRLTRSLDNPTLRQFEGRWSPLHVGIGYSKAI